MNATLCSIARSIVWLSEHVKGHMHHADADDSELIALTRAGRDDAFAELYRRHSFAAVRLARHLGHREDSDDVAGEAFVRILDLLRQGRGPEGSFRSYLHAAIRSESKRRLRADGQIASTDDDSVNRALEDFATGRLDAFERPTIRAAYESLPERWRSVLWSIEVERRKPQDLAAHLGLTANGVSALAYRARSGLRDAYLAQHLKLDPADGVLHADTRALFVPVLRATASRGERVEVQTHLASCEPCRAVFAELEVDAGNVP